MIALLEARMALIEHARPSVGYCRQHGLDWPTIEAACSGVFLAPIRPEPGGRFTFDETGTLAAVVEVLAADGETVIDIAAWSLTDPTRWRTAIGAAVALGETVAWNPSTYAFGRPLRLFRTPLRWLQAGCDGACILDTKRAARWLQDVPSSTVAAADDGHAIELETLRRALLKEQTIVVPAEAVPLREVV